jgi:hypothetical protein
MASNPRNHGALSGALLAICNIYSNPGKEFRPLQYKQRMVQSVALRIT